MKNLTQADYMRAKMAGHKWAVIGLIIGGTSTAFKGIFAFQIFIIALTYLQGREYKMARQQLEGMMELEKKVKSLEEQNGK